MRFEAYEWLAGLWLAPALAGLVWYAVARRRILLRRFIEAGLVPHIASAVSPGRQALKAALLIGAAMLVLLALARPQWGATAQEVQRQGRDVCFVIDVSRSMLAEDVVPNRLERAKLWVQDVMRIARGDRVGLVAFAGHAVVLCPLTYDYGFATLQLADMSPESVSRGGTLIGDAIRKALTEVFDTQEPTFKDIILITDGEDHESFPVEAAKAAGEAGVRVIAIGVGDENVGRPIPITDPRTGEKRLIRYKGETVLSKLDGDTMRRIAAESRGGVYYNVATGTIELDTVYQRLIRQAEQTQAAGEERVRYEERFQIFIAVAIGLLCLERVIRERRSA